VSAGFARKRFGQHFLHEPGVVDHIVRVLAPKPGQALIEIGPGLGALTVPVLQAAGELTAIELDRDVVPRLLERCGHAPGLRVIQADALKTDVRTLFPAGTRLRVFGNLPYNISTPLLFHLLEASESVEDMHFMLQKEVVERMTAPPGGDAYGRLTVSVAVRAECASLFTVGPGAFTPRPKVDSAVVRIRPRPAPFPIHDFGRFEQVVRQAFSLRRKTLANGLRGLLDAAAIRSVGIDPGCRAETLSAEQFARLSNAVVP
jgi:16S rRNA (adenine1518-N6/adenine1519-N6)-dimethyltransferase